MLKRLTIVALVLFQFVCVSHSTLAAGLNFGVVAPRGTLKAHAKWSELAKYFATQVGVPVKLIPLTPDKVPAAVADGKLQLILSNPVITAVLLEKYGVKPIATLAKKSGAQFAGVIIAKKGSGISKGADLKGKNVMAFKFGSSAAAYVFQVFHLKQEGIDPRRDFASFRQAKKQDDIVYAVKAGVIDAGFIKTGLLEAMAKEGKVKLNDFTIVDQRSGDGLAAVHSTALYPLWCLAVTSKANPDMVAKLKAAALGLSANTRAARDANIVGFVKPLSLDGMKATLKALNLPPYKK